MKPKEEGWERRILAESAQWMQPTLTPEDARDESDWDESESPRGMSGMEAGADILAGLIVVLMLGWVVYTVGF